MPKHRKLTKEQIMLYRRLIKDEEYIENACDHIAEKFSDKLVKKDLKLEDVVFDRRHKIFKK